MSAATSQSAASQSFVRRRVDVTFQLGPRADAQGNPVAKPTFAESSGSDTVTVSGLRCSAAITKAGGVSQGALDLRVYGLTQSVMNQLSGSIRGLPYVLRPSNIVTVKAGTDASGLAVAYQGTISDAWAEYDGSPDVFFHVLGIAAYDAALISVPPSSYKGAADVAVIMADLARLAGMNFENNGVSGIILSNPYFPGTAYQQIEACARAAGIEMFVDDGGGGGRAHAGDLAAHRQPRRRRAADLGRHRDGGLSADHGRGGGREDALQSGSHLRREGANPLGRCAAGQRHVAGQRARAQPGIRDPGRGLVLAPVLHGAGLRRIIGRPMARTRRSGMSTPTPTAAPAAAITAARSAPRS